MHNGMHYDPIQSQGQGHEPFKLNFNGNPAVFKSYLLRHLQWELATDHEFLNYIGHNKFFSGRGFDIRPRFCVT